MSEILINSNVQLDINPSHLPSNTILITLSPPGGTFYLPPSTPISPRSSTPSVGYTSDPESEIRKAKQIDQYSWDTSVQSSLLLPLSKRRRHHTTGTSVDGEGGVISAGWAELFKCGFYSWSSIPLLILKP